MDREKVIKGLERCLICDISVVASEEAQNAYRECEYTVGRYCGEKKLIRDALSLLKEQESIIESLKLDLSETLDVVTNRKNVVKCGNCKHGVRLDDTNYIVCSRPFASNRETHTEEWFCADGSPKEVK